MLQFFAVRDFLRGAQYVTEVVSMQEKLNRVDEGRATFDSYIAQGLVKWRHFQQRPLSFQPFLASTPFPPLIPATALLLQEHIAAIQTEFDLMLATRKAEFQDHFHDDPRLLVSTVQ